MQFETVYHVTHTEKVPKILRQGLLPMQTSNWVRGHDGTERYGDGALCVFTDLHDAQWWGARMEWEFYQCMGEGNVTILTINAEGLTWEEDRADPLSQVGSRGKWLKVYRRT